MGGAVGKIFQAVAPILSLIPGVGPAIAGISALVQNVGGFAQAIKQGNVQEARRQEERLQQTAQDARRDIERAGGAVRNVIQNVINGNNNPAQAQQQPAAQGGTWV